MAEVTGTLPYDLDDLLGGGARVLISDDAGALPAIPANVKDVIDPEDPYTAKTGWRNVGATTDGTTASRDMDSEGYEIEQTSGVVFEEITEITRQIEVEMAGVSPANLVVMENASGVTNIAAAAGHVAQKAIKFGSIRDLKLRRVAFIGQRNIRSGIVEESVGGVERGRFVMYCAYSCAIAADSSEATMEKGELMSLPVTFNAFPEAGQPQGQEYGTWILEDAGTIA